MKQPLILIILLAGSVSSLKASPQQKFKEGKMFGQGEVSKGDRSQISSILGTPQANPKESTYRDAELGSKAQSLLSQERASAFIVESSNKRPKINIDTQHDPLIKRSNTIEANALAQIGGEGTKLVKIECGTKTETRTCEEAGDVAELTCKSNLLVEVKEEIGPIQNGEFALGGSTVYKNHQHLLKLIRVKSKHFVGYVKANEDALKKLVSDSKKIPLEQIKSASASHSGDWFRVDPDHKKRYAFASYIFRYTYQPIIRTPKFTWVNDCASLEEKSDQGLCSYVTKVCTQGRQTRIIDGLPVTQDCWQETFTYSCVYPAKNGCGQFLARGCIQINSTCKEYVGKTCVVHTQTYQCSESKQCGALDKIEGGKTPFCLDGNCADQSWESNDELGSALSQLSLLKEMQGQAKNPQIFSGSDDRCKKKILNFNDCCRDKGWGQTAHLASCSPSEEQLALKKKKRLCHYVGTYCHKKVLGKCVTKKSTYCCFGTKLSRIFHEQGRQQINLGWGTPQAPICRGFTIEEIQKIDFSKLDLSEVYHELVSKYKAPSKDALTRRIDERMKAIQNSLTPQNKKNPPKQRGEA